MNNRDAQLKSSQLYHEIWVYGINQITQLSKRYVLKQKSFINSFY